jgi:hypothetical protein
MGKNTHFFGQPVFSQLLSLVDKTILSQVRSKHHSDRYYKKFDTWQHLVTMLFCSFSGATSLRELSTGLLAWQNKLLHIGMPSSPKRSTISNGNSKRPSEVFKDIYMVLFEKYRHVLPDSRLKMEVIKKLFIVDSTVISLFKDILKVAGRPRKDGKSKGGIKAHVMIHAEELMPCMIRFTEGVRHDSTFLKHLNVAEGSYIVMDKGYTDYLQYAQWSDRGIYFITRMKDNARYESIEIDLPDDKDHEIIKDESITLEYTVNGKKETLKLRRVALWDDTKSKVMVFLTNSFDQEAATIAGIYKYRWQIELLFKKLKQNFPLKYFLGDNQNAIEIQIWCSLISLLLMEVVRKTLKRNWAFSNMVALVRFHMVSYVHLINFLNDPEKELKESLKNQGQITLFPT